MIRRTLLGALAFAAIAGSGTFLPAVAQDTLTPVMPIALKDVVLGDPAAPILIEEYASMTCIHCAAFSNDVLPELKTRYIDTGKVRYVLKPFPIDAVSAGAFLLARCDGDEDFYPRIEHLFATQATWLPAEAPGDALLAAMGKFGFDGAKYTACLENRSALTWIMDSRTGAEFVTGTPTFVIGGQTVKGNMPIENFANILDPMIEALEE